jgi:hypothetical protein
MTSAATMSATNSIFEDFDDPNVYNKVEGLLLSERARNFVVEFGAHEAKIAFNLPATKFERLVKQNDPPRSADRPVRWM